MALAEQLESDTRRLAMEFLVTMCEAREKAPGMMRKLPQFADKVYEALMLFLLDMEDEELWHSAEDEQHEEEGAGELCDFGQVGARGCWQCCCAALPWMGWVLQ